MSNPRTNHQWFSQKMIVPAVLVLIRLAIYVLVPEPYGIFRDELYYLACADHLAFGYVDHPPFSIFILAIVKTLFGTSLPALRLVPVLAHCITIVVAARIAVEFGGRKFAAALASLAVLTAPVYLAFSSFFSMNELDVMLATLAVLVLARLLNGANERLWLLFGLICGIGLENKVLFGLLGVGVVIGLATTPSRTAFRSRWLWFGGVVAFALILPHLIWQATHNWPLIEFTSNARKYKMAGFNPLGFLGAQVINMGPVALPLWITGLVALLRSQTLKRFRFLGILFLTVLAGVLILGGKSYYLASSYVVLFCAGAVWLESREHPGIWKLVRIAYTALLAIGGIILAPLALPTLPPDQFIRYASVIGIEEPRNEKKELGALPQQYADHFGWENQAATVAKVFHALPESDRRSAVIFAGNYGEAGAIDFFGKKYGLPHVVSTHNSYWLWGPGTKLIDVVIAFGMKKEDLQEAFEVVEEKARIESPYAMPYENNLPVYVCRGLKAPIGEIWAQAKKYI